MRLATMRLATTRLVTFAVLFAALFAFLASLMPAPVRAEDVAAMISAYRKQYGLVPVKTDPELTAVAERQAKAMAASGIMDHSVAGTFATRISGIGTVAAAENIAAGTKTWEDTLRMWKASPGHNENLLCADCNLVGVAVARNEQTRYKVFWAMVVARKGSAGRRVRSASGTKDDPNSLGIMDSISSVLRRVTSGILP